EALVIQRGTEVHGQPRQRKRDEALQVVAVLEHVLGVVHGHARAARDADVPQLGNLGPGAVGGDQAGEQDDRDDLRFHGVLVEWVDQLCPARTRGRPGPGASSYRESRSVTSCLVFSPMRSTVMTCVDPAAPKSNMRSISSGLYDSAGLPSIAVTTSLALSPASSAGDPGTASVVTTRFPTRRNSMPARENSSRWP